MMTHAPSHNDTLSPLGIVHAKIAKAAKTAGRKPEDIELIAISKLHPAEAALPLIAEGQRVFGENRVQEALEKWPALIKETPDIRLHCVGQLQSNKAKTAVELFDAIHSVDRPSLIEALARAMDTLDKRPECFIQVNIGEEEQKGGCDIADTKAILKQCRDAGIPIIGLMSVPPLEVEPAPYFALTVKMAHDLGLPAVSIGMSADYELAITLGATHIRVGTALFGHRA
ncbi:YggS family pyridoxal phosphate-dependent enzyme [Zymomonas mobilis]|uniref:YggS family pyridoxal phosphate-dependent enzyme n=1 Tax=Zymomonas mobilis TaxID=542 RepID=UPI0039EAB277